MPNLPKLSNSLWSYIWSIFEISSRKKRKEKKKNFEQNQEQYQFNWGNSNRKLSSVPFKKKFGCYSIFEKQNVVVTQKSAGRKSPWFNLLAFNIECFEITFERVASNREEVSHPHPPPISRIFYGKITWRSVLCERAMTVSSWRNSLSYEQFWTICRSRT